MNLNERLKRKRCFENFGIYVQEVQEFIIIIVSEKYF